MPNKNPVIAARQRRAWYEKNRQSEIDNSAARKVVQIKRNYAITDAAKNVPCTDCGVGYPPYVMQFDHTGDNKADNVSRMVRTPVSVQKLLDEIAKCEVVCANCHAIRTHNRRSTHDVCI